MQSEAGAFRVVVATDKFRGSLSHAQAESAMARGVERALGERCSVRVVAMSDGGEGFARAMAAMQKHWVVPMAVPGPIVGTSENGAGNAAVELVVLNGPPRWVPRDGKPLTALVDSATAAVGRAAVTPAFVLTSVVLGLASPFLFLLAALHHRPENRRAVVTESAQAIGLGLVEPSSRDPERASTAGLGAALAGALKQRPRTIIVGLGGSATVDGGIGMAAALGYRFVGHDGTVLEPVGGSLGAIARVFPPRLGSRGWRMVQAFRRVDLVAACDVDNPLCGPRGAARVYGPQKGADAAAVERLDAGLMNMRQRCVEAGLTPNETDRAGDGSAGGLGFGLRVFCGARLVAGSHLLADRNGLDHALADADLLLTGEGAMDEQSAAGKVVWTVAQRAARKGVPARIIAGRVLPSVPAVQSSLERAGMMGVRVRTLLDAAGGDERAAMERAEELVEEVVAEEVGEATKKTISA